MHESTRTTFGIVVALIIIIIAVAAGIVLLSSSPVSPPGGAEEATTTPFAAVGNLTRDNPGQEPGTWYLVYEEPGAPALSVKLDFASTTEAGLSAGERVRVEGERQDDTVFVRAVTKADAASTMTIKLYFYDPSRDQGPGGAQCSAAGLVAVERVIPRTPTPLRDSVSLLLRGELTAEERAKGITTEFPLEGVSLTSAVITNGVATLTFADPQNKTGGGSCRVAILWHQIEATAKQFPTVANVRFMPEELFQP